MKKSEKKLERISDGLFSQLTTAEIRLAIGGDALCLGPTGSNITKVDYYFDG